MYIYNCIQFLITMYSHHEKYTHTCTLTLIYRNLYKYILSHIYLNMCIYIQIYVCFSHDYSCTFENFFLCVLLEVSGVYMRVCLFTARWKDTRK